MAKVTFLNILFSMEARWRFKLMILVSIAISLIMYLTNVYSNYLSNYEKINNVVIIVLSLIFLKHLISYILLFINIKDYKEYIVVLDDPKRYLLARKCYRFNVSFEDEDDETIYIKTKPMFGKYFFNSFSISRYEDECVTIAYNKYRNKMVVLSKI